MIQLSNDLISASIHPDGAELRSLVHLGNGRQYLWKGDPAFWGKFSPVLFPIVGTLKDNKYVHLGQEYSLWRHGFAREKTFSVEQLSSSEARFSLADDETTRKVFPFAFRLHLNYRLYGPRLILTYTVENPGSGDLYFCLGAHPAFAVPNAPDLAYDDYYLEFSEPETAGRWELEGGLLKAEPTPYLDAKIRIPLSKELFSKDAIVLKGLRSQTLVLASAKDPHGLCFGIEGWPHLGLWAAPGADFVCIEPWQGHADHVNDGPELRHKEGVVRLNPGGSWSKSWWVELF
jgi:galactose mutarotase-like enzyme